MNFPFDAEKATEAAKLILNKEGGQISILKLVKLLYLSERESIQQREYPLFGGKYFSLKDGPITSECYDLMKGEGPQKDQALWYGDIEERDGNTIRLKATAVMEAESLSRSEEKIIGEVYEQHGDKTPSQIRKWCHDHIPEYEEVFSGCKPILLKLMAEKTGSNVERVEEEAKASAFFRNAS